MGIRELSNKNKKDFILESIQKMNLSLLEVLLDNNKIYQGAKKEVFLEKLGIAFDKLIKMGDTFLFAHEGICTCENPLRKGLKGYSFVGNNFNNCIDLIFIELTDDFKDIYNACCFEIFDKTIETAMKVRIDVKLDEKADFKPSIDFLIKSQKYKLASDQLYRHQNKIIDKAIYIPWLKKHANLRNYFDDVESSIYEFHYSEFSKFHDLYYKIHYLKKFLQLSNITEVAINEYKSADMINELILIKWLVKYEDIGLELIVFIDHATNHENFEKFEYFDYYNLKIGTNDFLYIAKFKIIFDKYYYDIHEKYKSLHNLHNIDNKQNNEDYPLSYYVNKLDILIE